MNLLSPNEVLLEGKWIFDGKKMSSDDTCSRIEYLVKNILKQVANGDWEALFQDPIDDRYWELSYPQSHLHGGGPPMLKVISFEVAKNKYSIV
ncbi:MAG: Imm27 family immunity protein [Tumebacillaceae bacterium]